MIDFDNDEIESNQTDASEDVSVVEESLDDIVDDGSAEGDEPAGFSLQSPEMAAKIQLMHENLPLRAQLEAAIFAAPNPLKAEELLDLVSHKISVEEIKSELEALTKDYTERQGGFTLENVKGLGYQFQTNAVAAPIMAKMFASRPRPLSRAALETLSIIAYRQPCTRASVEFIRGVDSGSIIKNLLERSLIRCTGRKEDAGRPMLFGTTDEFLQVFGIGNLKDLPPLSSFQPSTDTMREALKELEKIDAVNPEEFVADVDESLPKFSAGLLSDVELAEQMIAAEEQADTSERIEGASLAPEVEPLVVANEEENPEQIEPLDPLAPEAVEPPKDQLESDS